MKDEHYIMLGRIDDKVDRVLATLQAEVILSATTRKRVSSLEGWRSWILGAVAATTLIASIALSTFKDYFGK